MGYFSCVTELAKEKMGEACLEEMSKPFYEENGGTVSGCTVESKTKVIYFLKLTIHIYYVIIFRQS